MQTGLPCFGRVKWTDLGTNRTTVSIDLSPQQTLLFCHADTENSKCYLET